jgi:LmbE family N-acetylglucosaminyl deacetylase
VLSAWSVLRSPGETIVVNFCTAVPPPGPPAEYDRMKAATDAASFMEARLAEDAEALALAGCRRLNLGFPDLQYSDGPLAPDAVREALLEAAPAPSAICAPAGIGGHPDHLVVRDVAIEIGRVRSAPVSLYADLPYAVRVGWPAWVSGAPPRDHLVPEVRWERFLPRHVELEPRVSALGPDEAALKLRALEAYRTEFAVLNAGPLDRLRNPEVIGFELFWEIPSRR